MAEMKSKEELFAGTHIGFNNKLIGEVLIDIRDLLKRYVDISERAVNKSLEVIDIDEKRLQEIIKEISKPESEGK